MLMWTMKIWDKQPQNKLFCSHCVHLKHGLSRNKESSTADDPHYNISGLMRLLIHVGVISVNHIPVGSEGACKRAELTRIHEHYLVYVHVLTCYENA